MSTDIIMDKLVYEFYRKKIILRGNFELKSGQTSEIYINCRRISEFPSLMKLISNELEKKIIKSDWICGVPTGAVPFATAISLINETPQLLLRKEKKDYGTNKQIEGDYNHKDKVVVLEDVVTTGGSLEKYNKFLTDSGLDIIQQICIINRGNIPSVESLIPIQSLLNPNNILLPKLDQKIIWAADVPSMKVLFSELDKYGRKIGVLKLHIDTFKDFSVDNLIKLVEYKEKYNLIIWEDRKFADIGFIMDKQIKNSTYCYEDWVDVFSIHCITGNESLEFVINQNPKFKWILIGQLSSSENLITSEYTEKCKDNYKNNKNVVGMVCQEYLGPDYIHIVPGISKSDEGDNKGQKYNTIQEKNFADFFVVGRSISKFFN